LLNQQHKEDSLPADIQITFTTLILDGGFRGKGVTTSSSIIFVVNGIFSYNKFHIVRESQFKQVP